MDKPMPAETSRMPVEEAREQAVYHRFDLSQRIEHMVFLLSFTTLEGPVLLMVRSGWGDPPPPPLDTKVLAVAVVVKF